ncbi:MAG: protein kinase [Aquihabitans sp.]
MSDSEPSVDQADEDPCPRCGHAVADAWLVCAWCGQQLAVPAELEVGARLGDGRYQVLSVIGRGGFGITYDAGDRRLQRRVAMKELFPESAVRHGSLVLTPPQGRASFREARARFLREARVLARFTHPGIVRVYEVFEEHGTAYLVMELLQGRTLVELLQQHGAPFDEEVVLDVAGRVAAALRPVHAAGVLHRDVNPSNVMMTHHGRIVVIDFGLARDYDADETVGMTRVVTPGYAPLEQYRGEGRFGPATDVYGLAATCYRLATGRVPAAAIDRDAGAELPSPHQLNPGISKQVSDAILDGLELESSHRPQDLDGFLTRLGIGRPPEGPRSILLEVVPPAGTETVPTQAAMLPAPPDPGPDARPVPVSEATGYGHRDEALDPFDDTAVSSDETVIVGRPAPRWSEGNERDDDRTWAASDGDATVNVGAGSRDGAARPVDPTGTAVLGSPTYHFRPSTPPPDVGVTDDRGAMRARLPGPIGPHGPGRIKVLLPLTAVALATASAAPVLVTAILVLLVLPLIATLGDSATHRLRLEYGMATGWAERRLAPITLAPARFLRNVLVSAVRSIPAVGLGALMLLGWYAMHDLGAAPMVLSGGLRATGLIVVGLILATSRNPTSRFRSGVGLEELTALVLPDGRTNERAVVIWLLAAALVAASLWLTPSPFPLP